MAPRKKNKSEVWNYFARGENGTAFCKFCGKTLKTSGNTSNLICHLEKIHKHPKSAKSDKHNVENEGSETDESSCSGSTSVTQSVIETFKHIDSFTEGGFKHSKISDSILYMICKDNLPLSAVENSGFVHFMKTVAPLYKLPGRKYFTNLLEQKYDCLRNVFKKKTQTLEFLALTTDIWTDTNQTRSFLGLTVHFLEGNTLQSGTIGVYMLEERHSAENIAKVIQQSCNEWGFTERKIVGIVSDNWANIVKACTDLFGRNRHIHCCAHTLNLISEKILKEGNDIIERMRRIVKWFKSSVVGSDELRKVQKNRGIPEGNVLKLIQDVPTRWNSTYYMMERFILLSKQVSEVLLSIPAAPPMLTAVEIDIIKDFEELLKPLELVTKEMSGEKYITVSKVIPVIRCMEKQIETVSPRCESVRNFKKCLKNEVQKRFGQMEYVHHLAISTILDPRFKKLHFTDPIAAARAIKAIKTIILNEISVSTETVISETKDNNVSKNDDNNDIWKHHEMLLKMCVGSNERSLDFTSILDAEMLQYLNTPLSKLSDDPIQTWESIKSTFPNLYKVARRYLQVPGTSVPCERLFSKAGQILTERRNRLTGKRLDKLIFLNSINKDSWNKRE